MEPKTFSFILGDGGVSILLPVISSNYDGDYLHIEQVGYMDLVLSGNENSCYEFYFNTNCARRAARSRL